MRDLTTTSFNDNQIIKSINMILQGRSEISVITNDEKELIKRKNEILVLNDKCSNLEPKVYLSNLIVSKLNFIAAYDLIRYLLEANKRDRLEEAIESLDTIETEEKTMTFQQFLDLLNDDSDDSPLSWKIILLGENEKRIESKPVKKSSIDLNRLRDFK